MARNHALLFSATVACVLVLMASHAAKPAAACSTPTLSASCSSGNPSVIDFSGCDYDDCGNGGEVIIYAGCDSNCQNCTQNSGFPVANTTTNSNGCSGHMSGSFDVKCSSPNEGYVCAQDLDGTGKLIPYDLGSCQCTDSPTAARGR